MPVKETDQFKNKLHAIYLPVSTVFLPKLKKILPYNKIFAYLRRPKKIVYGKSMSGNR
jgi:hypothetical protein